MAVVESIITEDHVTEVCNRRIRTPHSKTKAVVIVCSCAITIYLVFVYSHLRYSKLIRNHVYESVVVEVKSSRPTHKLTFNQ